jgi:HSP20 family protein
MLAQWDPFADIARVHDRFFGPANSERGYQWKPSVDVFEDEAGVHLNVDVPGIKPEDLKIEVEKNVLTVRGERKLEHEDKKEGYHRVERYFGSFSRSFALGDEVNSEQIDAKYESGVLRINLQKRPAAKRREIAVKASS